MNLLENTLSQYTTVCLFLPLNPDNQTAWKNIYAMPKRAIKIKMLKVCDLDPF